MLSTFGGLSLPLAVAAGGLLMAYLALFPAFVAVVIARVCGRIGPAGLLVTPAVWVATELVRRWVLGGFPWVLLGSSQAGVTPIVQTASLAGVYGLSAVVALVSAALALAVAGRGRARSVAPAAAACLVVAPGGLGRVACARGLARPRRAGRPRRPRAGEHPAEREVGQATRLRHSGSIPHE